MGSELSAGTQQQHGQLPPYMYTSLKDAAAYNPAVELLPKNKARYRAHKSEKPLNIVSSLVGITLVWALTGCLPGKQHLRECVPHTIKNETCVRCPWCDYDEGDWTAAGKQKIPDSERKLMAQLIRTGWDLYSRWQMKLPFWAAPVDFVLKLCRLVILQADGSCHFDGMFEESASKKLETDLRFCVLAIAAGHSVVRVHEADVNSSKYPAYLPAAIKAAAASQCVVLSPGYSTTYIYDKGLLITYADLLATLLPGGCRKSDSQNNTVIFLN